MKFQNATFVREKLNFVVCFFAGGFFEVFLENKQIGVLPNLTEWFILIELQLVTPRSWGLYFDSYDYSSYFKLGFGYWLSADF